MLAHELAHIRNRDILIGSIAAVMAGALMFISRMGMWAWPSAADEGKTRRGSPGGNPVLALVLAPWRH